jgi:hypothetical protein
MDYLVETEIDQDALGTLIKQAKVIANQYKKLTDRPLGITGEVAEYEAARLLGLRLARVREAGYDAIDPKTSLRVQVKGRVLHTAKLRGRVPAISLKQQAWDVVLLVLLNPDLEPIKIYEAKRSEVEKRLLAPGSKSRNERGSMDISQFISIAQLVWPVTNI